MFLYVFSSRTLVENSHFDEHIFQLGWWKTTHHLDMPDINSEMLVGLVPQVHGPRAGVSPSFKQVWAREVYHPVFTKKILDSAVPSKLLNLLKKRPGTFTKATSLWEPPGTWNFTYFFKGKTSEPNPSFLASILSILWCNFIFEANLKSCSKLRICWYS